MKVSTRDRDLIKRARRLIKKFGEDSLGSKKVLKEIGQFSVEEVAEMFELYAQDERRKARAKKKKAKSKKQGFFDDGELSS